MKIRITYSEQERAAFERIRAELLQSLPNVRQHSAERRKGALPDNLQKLTFYGIIYKI
ncbi:MAG: hypothetical protein ACLURG_09605 [Gemmiger sp.]